MLKNILKSCITAAAVVAMAAPAMAADEAKVTVNGQIREYFGQYDSGEEGYTAHFDNIGEANLKINASIGKVKVFYEVESRTDDFDFRNTKRKISYDASFGRISMGTITNLGGVPLAYGGGALTSEMGVAPYNGLFFAGFTEEDGIDLLMPLGDITVQVSYWDEAAVAISNKLDALNSILIGGGGDSKGRIGIQGTTMALGANIKAGPATVRVGYTAESEQEDDNWEDDASTDTLSNTFMYLGVLVPIRNMAIVVNYSSATVANDADTDKTVTVTGLEFSMTELGPGKLIASYEMTGIKDDGEDFLETNKMGLSYNIELATGCGVNIVYYSEANKAYTTTAQAFTDVAMKVATLEDVITESYMGAGLYAKF